MENTRAVLIEELRQKIDDCILSGMGRDNYVGCYGVSDLNDNFLEGIVRIVSKGENHVAKITSDAAVFDTAYKINSAIIRRTGTLSIRFTLLWEIIKATQKVVDFDSANAYDLIKEVKQELFEYLDSELGVTALDGQLDDIINICNRLNDK